MEYIKEELKGDYDIDVPSEWERVGPVKTYERPDGWIHARFHYHYDEEGDRPWNDHSAFVSFRGSLLIDPQGNIASISMKLAQKEIRARGPDNFLSRHAAEQADSRKEREALIPWEETLRCGDIVQARFSIRGAYFEFFGEIAKINPKSFRVVLRDTSVNSDFDGEEVPVPRRLSSAFSVNKGVFPLG